MLGIFVLMLIIISLAAATGYALFSMQISVDSLGASRSNTMKMDRIALQIANNLKPVGDTQVLYAPLGKVDTDVAAYMMVPDWITRDSNTPWGVPYSYCPYTPEGFSLSGNNSTVVQGGGNSYAVQTQSANSLNAGTRDYVVSSPNPPVTGEGIVGFLVSPLHNKSTVPNCSSISLSDGGYRVSEGTVRPIVTKYSEAYSFNKPGDIIRYVSPDGTGFQDGLSEANAMPFEDLLEMWDEELPRSIIVYLTDGEYTLFDDDGDVPVEIGFFQSHEDRNSHNKYVNLIGLGDNREDVHVKLNAQKVKTNVNISFENFYMEPTQEVKDLPWIDSTIANHRQVFSGKKGQNIDIVFDNMKLWGLPQAGYANIMLDDMESYYTSNANSSLYVLFSSDGGGDYVINESQIDIHSPDGNTHLSPGNPEMCANSTLDIEDSIINMDAGNSLNSFQSICMMDRIRFTNSDFTLYHNNSTVFSGSEAIQLKAKNVKVSNVNSVNGDFLLEGNDVSEMASNVLLHNISSNVALTIQNANDITLSGDIAVANAINFSNVTAIIKTDNITLSSGGFLLTNNSHITAFLPSNGIAVDRNNVNSPVFQIQSQSTLELNATRNVMPDPYQAIIQINNLPAAAKVFNLPEINGFSQGEIIVGFNQPDAFIVGVQYGTITEEGMSGRDF